MLYDQNDFKQGCVEGLPIFGSHPVPVFPLDGAILNSCAYGVLCRICQLVMHHEAGSHLYRKSLELAYRSRPIFPHNRVRALYPSYPSRSWLFYWECLTADC